MRKTLQSPLNSIGHSVSGCLDGKNSPHTDLPEPSPWISTAKENPTLSPSQSGRKDGRENHRNRALILPFVFLLALSGCGGGGGGGVGSGPLEIAYVLSQDTQSSNAGYVVEYGLNSSTNQFQISGNGPISTQGQTPFQFLLNPDKTRAFVLNNVDPTQSPSGNGSVAVYSVGTNGLSTTPAVFQTGQNPVNMALDPGGNYLVVANHGDGTKTGSGSVEVFPITTSGQLGAPSISSSPCVYPFRVVFAPRASGTSGDVVYVACTSPELLGNSSSLPPASIYVCTIQELTGSECTAPPVLQSSSDSEAFVNFAIDPTNTYAVAPGTTSTQSGFLLVCSINAPSLSCPAPPSSISSSWIPSGNIAFGGTSASPVTYIGNYDPSSSLSDNFADCTITVTTSSASCTSSDTTPTAGPLYLAIQGNVLYIADTVTAINGSFSTSGTTSGASPPSSGYLYSCPTPPSNCTAPSSTSSTGNTGGWPVGIFFDTRNMVFVPTLSGEVNIFTGASTGNLVPFQTLSDPYTPLSVTIQ